MSIVSKDKAYESQEPGDRPKAIYTADKTKGGGEAYEPSGTFAVKLAALHDLSIELSLTDGFDELCERAVRLGRMVLGFDRISIWFADQKDPSFIHGSFGTDESGKIRDERGIRIRRAENVVPANFYEGKEPVYFMTEAPCFDDWMNPVGEADKALALLWDGKKVIGEVVVDNVLTKRPIGGGDLDLLVRFARLVGCMANFKIEQAELGRLSGTDELTGIVNRRTAILVLEKQFGLCLRNRSVLSVAFFDLDGLKAINDALGHAAGDEYIKSSCALLAKAVRNTDTVGRLGGDEFLAVLPDCDIAGAEAMGRRARTLVDEWNHVGGRSYTMSFSVGFASSREIAAEAAHPTATALVELADSRMYDDKARRKAGRTR
jgi:diguanylate cyclase (GGDEF)-like protein